MVFVAKIMQTSEKTSSLLECFSECSLSYVKIVQTSEKSSSLLECFSECSLSYVKIVQTSEKSSSSLECFSECSLSYLKILHFILSCISPKSKMGRTKNALPIYYIIYLLSYLAFTDIFIFFPSTDTTYMPLAGATTLPLEPCATTLPDMS